MAGDRTLKLSLLADTKGLVDGLKAGSQATESFADQMGEIAKKVGAAFAAIGAAAAAFSYEAVKNALADEAAQRKLEETIRASTNATVEQVKAVGDYIDKTSIAIGVTDDEMRPALARLIRSTNDTEKAMELLNLALDITAATGKPLETVANALGKAYDGNSASLGRLGLGLDANILKSKDFDLIYQQLTKTFGSFAENEAETTNKKFERLKIVVDEARERIGTALLPAVTQLGDWLLTEGVPRLDAFIAGLIGDKSLSYSFDVAQKQAEGFGSKIRTVIDTVIEYKDALIAAAAITATVFVVSKIAAGVTATIALIKSLIVAYNALKASAIVAGVASAFALNPLLGVGAAALAAGVLSAANALANKYETDVSGLGANTGGTNLGNRPLGGNVATAPSTVTPSGAGTSLGSSSGTTTSAKGTASIKPAPTLIEQVTAENAFKKIPAGAFDPGRFRQADERGNTINVTVNGAVDPVATARQIATILNTEASTSGTFVGLGTSRFDQQAL